MERRLLELAAIIKCVFVLVIAAYLIIFLQTASASVIVAVNPISCFNTSDCSEIAATRMVDVGGGESNITNFITYKGNKTVKNFTIFENMSKNFAESANEILVDVPGASIKILERDPAAYRFVFPEISPGQQITFTYRMRHEISAETVNEIKTEIYGIIPETPEEIITEPETICTPGERVCFGDDLNECNAEGTDWNVLETCQYGCSGLGCNLADDGNGVDSVLPEVDNNSMAMAAVIIIIIAGLIVIAKVL